jgi:Astacin (Peptidase family M12A)
MKLCIRLVSAALIVFVSLARANEEDGVVHSSIDPNVKATMQVPTHPHRSLQLQLNQRWKDRIGDVIIVPYTIVGSFTSAEIDLIDRSVKDLGDQSAVVQFVRRTNQRAYIEVGNDGSGCNSHIGRIYTGTVQTLNLASECFVVGIIQHEFLHAVRACKSHSVPLRSARVQPLTFFPQSLLLVYL